MISFRAEPHRRGWHVCSVCPKLPTCPVCFISLSLPSVHGGGGGNEAAPSKQTNCYSNALLHCHGNANLVEIHKESFKPTLTGAVTSLTRITQYFLDVQASIQELGRRQHTEAWKIHLKGDSVFSKCNPQCLHCFFC